MAIISKGPGEALLPESAARSGQSSAPLSGENSEAALRNESSMLFFVTESIEKPESTSTDLSSEASILASVMVFQRNNSHQFFSGIFANGKAGFFDVRHKQAGQFRTRQTADVFTVHPV